MPTDAAVVEVIHPQVERLTRPGTWLTGAQRAAVVDAARHAMDAAAVGHPSAESPPVVGDARGAPPVELSSAGDGRGPARARPHSARSPSLGHSAQRRPRKRRAGLPRAPGGSRGHGSTNSSSVACRGSPTSRSSGLVARVSAIDTYAWATGRPRWRRPQPRDGQPTRAIVAGARKRSAWVPIVGAASAPTAVSAVSAASRERRALSAVLYLDDEDVARASDGGGDRDGLRRHHLEVVAVRASFRNDCFY